MRVLHIIPSLDQAGAEKQLLLLARGLPREEFDVQICALTRMGPLLEPLREAGIDVSCVHKKWRVDPAAYWRLKREIARRKPDIVHTWIFAANSYGRQAARAAGVPHILAGERCVDRWKSWHELAIDRYLARFTDCIVTNSTGVRDFYAERGVPAEKFVVIPNGIAPPPPASTGCTREELLAELGLPRNVYLVGVVGRLWPQKRHKDVVWTIDLLTVIRDDVHVLVLGDGPERERLQRFAEHIQIKNRVHFLGHRSDVSRFLPHFDLFWITSGYEGQSNSVMEAMSWGLPILASDIPGNRDLVVHEETGFLYPLGDRAKLASYSQLLLEDAERRRAMGAAGRSRILREFSVEKMVERQADLYRRVVAGEYCAGRGKVKQAHVS